MTKDWHDRFFFRTGCSETCFELQKHSLSKAEKELFAEGQQNQEEPLFSVYVEKA